MKCKCAAGKRAFQHETKTSLLSYSVIRSLVYLLPHAAKQLVFPRKGACARRIAGRISMRVHRFKKRQNKRGLLEVLGAWRTAAGRCTGGVHAPHGLLGERWRQEPGRRRHPRGTCDSSGEGFRRPTRSPCSWRRALPACVS